MYNQNMSDKNVNRKVILNACIYVALEESTYNEVKADFLSNIYPQFELLNEWLCFLFNTISAIFFSYIIERTS
jgi:hypothetical protein